MHIYVVNFINYPPKAISLVRLLPPKATSLVRPLPPDALRWSNISELSPSRECSPLISPFFIA
jgi:hypothetical protein